MEKFFNTAGPKKLDLNYTVPPLTRINFAEVVSLIEAQRYFVMHAPRQSGKTSCLLALQDELNRSGKYAAVYCNIEIAQAARENVDGAMNAITAQIAQRVEGALGDNFLRK